ncbi:MAG: hypothetical protein L0Y72_02100 [Gemmataceae bacterium]|nr:hypothetical protein [Gemmataceae bacterium]
MAFKDIACHVWAIDGYVNQETADEVNQRYTKFANSHTVANNLTARNQALLAIVTNVRMSALTKEAAIVYGGIRYKQNAPEHMWLEYDGKIYETMPGYDLEIADATPKTRKCPPLENDPFKDSEVASVATKLTVNQKAYLDSLK